jgi:signal peptidase I
MKYSLEVFLELKSSFNSNKKVRILSGSMEPFIYKDDIIIVSPKEIDSLQKGDVIVFWKDNKLICHLFHRFEKVQSQDCLITKGINSKKYDSPVQRKFFLGVIVDPKVTILKRVFFKLYLFLSR